MIKHCFDDDELHNLLLMNEVHSSDDEASSFCEKLTR